MQSEVPEFSTNSSDASERIAARRKRIDTKTNEDNEGDNGGKRADDGTSNEASRGKQQIVNSLNLLDHQKAKTIELVTSIRVDADNRENDRRIEEENKRQDRLWRLQEEAVASGKANAAVEMRWNDLMEHNMPQDLNREIMKQKKACGQIISSKDGLIKEFQAELKAKDEEYVKSLKRQADAIEELLARMTDQYGTLSKSYRVELDTIEDEFKAERADALEGNKKELDALFTKRRKMEMEALEAKLAREDKYQTDLEEMQAKDAEDYNKLKIKLETDIQTLEQQLEAMRATYLLNTEKLEYNYRVLSERDVENTATLNQQRRKLARLKDALSGLMQKYNSSDKLHKRKNQELTEEYRRITKQYKDLQTKFRHFEQADNTKYQEVWAMHEQDMAALVHKLLQADRIINEQLLGWQWQPPSSDALGGIAVGALAGLTEGAEEGSPPGTAGSAAGGGAGAGAGAGAGTGLGGTAATAGGGGKDDLEDEDDEEGEGKAADAAISAAVEARRAERRDVQVKMMLELLVQEASFLVDAAVQKQASQLPPEDGMILKADAILRALDVSSEEDIVVLLSYFYDDDADSIAEGDEEDAGPQLKVEPEAVVRTVKQFMEDREAQRREALAAEEMHTLKADNMHATRGSSDPHKRSRGASRAGTASSQFGGTAGGTGAGVQASTSTVETEHARTRREEREFWQRLADVIPAKSVRIWKALERCLGEYNQMLTDRSALIDDVDNLRNQNQELKNVLNHYLSADVNQELHVPPTQVIRIDTGTASSTQQ